MNTRTSRRRTSLIPTPACSNIKVWDGENDQENDVPSSSCHVPTTLSSSPSSSCPRIDTPPMSNRRRGGGRTPLSTLRTPTFGGNDENGDDLLVTPKTATGKKTKTTLRRTPGTPAFAGINNDPLSNEDDGEDDSLSSALKAEITSLKFALSSSQLSLKTLEAKLIVTHSQTSRALAIEMVTSATAALRLDNERREALVCERYEDKISCMKKGFDGMKEEAVNQAVELKLGKERERVAPEIEDLKAEVYAVQRKVLAIGIELENERLEVRRLEDVISLMKREGDLNSKEKKMEEDDGDEEEGDIFYDTIEGGDDNNDDEVVN
jgi:hypothetical protein